MKAREVHPDEDGHLYLEPGDYGFHDGQLFIRAPRSAQLQVGPSDHPDNLRLRVIDDNWKGWLQDGEWVEDPAPEADPVYESFNSQAPVEKPSAKGKA